MKQAAERRGGLQWEGRDTVGKRRKDAKTERGDPHCVGKATCVSYCLMNKRCQTNRIRLCAARWRHAAAKIAQSQTVEFEQGRNLGRTDEREETGEVESTEDERRPRGKHEECKDEEEEKDAEVNDEWEEEQREEREDRGAWRRRRMRRNRGKRR